MKPLLHFLLAASSLIVSQGALAQNPALTSKLTAQRVELVEGKSVLKPATEVKPGDVIEYSSVYQNGGSVAVDKLQATVPVPPGTTLIGGSAQPPQAPAPIDGIRFAPMPLVRTVKKSDGSERKENVPLADYRALRWEIGTLRAGSSSAVSLRVRIDTPVAASSVKP